MQNIEEATVSIALEGFQEPLNVSVDKTISPAEFQQLMSEILENYVLDLKEKAKIGNDRTDLIIINQEDYKEIKAAQINNLDNFKKIVIGFSEYDKLKTEAQKVLAMSHLNAKVANKDYREVELSISQARSTKPVLTVRQIAGPWRQSAPWQPTPRGR